MMQESELSRAAGRLRAVEQAFREMEEYASNIPDCLLYTSPSPRDA